jgi:hypothetical protein
MGIDMLILVPKMQFGAISWFSETVMQSSKITTKQFS